MTSSEKYPAGLPAAGKPAFFAIGRIRRSHGVRGEVLMEGYTDFPERVQSKITVYAGQEFQELTISSVRKHKDGLLIHFEGLSNPEEVAFLRNQIVYVSAANRPELPPGEYYHYQVIGMDVVDDSGTSLGTLTEILETSANDVYVVTNKQGDELLLPAIPDVVLDIDPQHNALRVHLLPGLVHD